MKQSTTIKDIDNNPYSIVNVPKKQQNIQWLNSLAQTMSEITTTQTLSLSFNVEEL